MKQVLLFVAAILLYSNVFSQQFSIKGKVLNQQQVPVEFVYVGLFKEAHSPVQQMVTDSLGQFTFKAAKGIYQVRMQHFGKEVINKEVLLEQDTDLGILNIQDATALQGVTVTAAKQLIERKVDRLVFNVEHAVMPTGGTALDALKAAPGVRVQNDVVSIVGKGEVLVMIDDRLQRMSQEDVATFLKSIPADHIKSIEVITTPPAQYEAEGNNGLINIKLKKAKANSWMANIGGSYIQKTYAGSNFQALFTYNHRQLAVQASISKSQQQLRTTSDQAILYPSAHWLQHVRTTSTESGLSTSVGVDYKLTSKWTTGVKYLGSFSDRDANNAPFTSIIDPQTQVAKGFIATTAQSANKPKMNSVNWYHAITLDSTGKSITIDMDYFSYKKHDNRFFAGNELNDSKQIENNTFFSSTNTNVNKIDNYSAKADISLPYKWANISVGGRVSYTNTNNDLAVFDHHTGTTVPNVDQSNIFNYKEHNEALYFSANKKLHSKWEMQLGLRMEATQTKGYSKNLDQTNTNNYTRLFPTAFITYAPSNDHSYSLSYSRRIRRPDFDYLNPFVIRTSPYFYSAGNPFLQPSYIDNTEFSYVHKQKWVSNLYYSQVTDFGQQLSIVDSTTNITKQTPVNYANTYQLGVSTYYNFNTLHWWNSFTGLNVNYQNVQSRSSFIQSIDGYNAYIYSNNDFTMNKGKTAFLGINYAVQLPGRYQIFHISTMHILDVSMKFLLMDKKLTLTVTGEDLLNAQRPLIAYYSNNIKNTVRSYGDSRGFRVSISYKMGNHKISTKQREAGNEDEKSRAH
ncbi:outer membrane receptor protein involved in Fe transport [Chitinophaga skermanii]|uniref:Outer membrane receptor protein involved in Fe transport n=1 Tax=Chitinophaga skermanii TaxID=331697 RepID=A0A327QUH9_9BACT|nr:outer membrane beta-barrel family protein [Chitinophaga skermanii]RAJ08336.1 outer membrane receptor protein involved in Fe transport [Chitinophaga skermanii]